MAYDPDIHHRRSIRLPGYDYAAAGYYYVTICTHGREITMEHEQIEGVVSVAWQDLPGRFAGAGIDEFVVMANHVHGIVVFRAGESTLGDVMRAFKSISAIAANRVLGRAGRPFWQRGYFERITATNEN